MKIREGRNRVEIIEKILTNKNIESHQDGEKTGFVQDLQTACCCPEEGATAHVRGSEHMPAAGLKAHAPVIYGAPAGVDVDHDSSL